MNIFGSLAKRYRVAVYALVVVGGAALAWSMGLIGITGRVAGPSEARATAADKPGDSKMPDDQVELSERQANALKIGAVGSRDFTLFKTAVGTIDFNENLLVQVFSQYAGKILKANFNIGDDVKAGEIGRASCRERV